MVEPPTGIDDHFDQLRDPIVRSKGATPSERYLAKLADRTFLDLWSYPNPFRDQKLLGGKDGKELCDLLVICDPHVIIFSEKNIGWPQKPVAIAWPRWFRKAVAASTAQLHGAERWISEHPSRIFLDRECSKPLPLALPAKERRRVHRVVVAHGAARACRDYFDGGTGSFVIRPDIKGDEHFPTNAPNYAPFCIGDIDPSADFVHVLDEATLETVLGQLDTISDLTRYFDKRAAFLRSGHLLMAHGEEDLLAYYAVRTDVAGQHDFTAPDGKEWVEGQAIHLDSSHFPGMIADPRYVAKRQADKVSYAWDSLIEAFTEHLLGGTSIVLPGFDYSLTESEVALRYMAQQSRLDRRGLGEALIDALRIGQSNQVFFRAVMWPEKRPLGTAFFFLTLKYEDWMDGSGGYEKYRLFRTAYAEIYAIALLIKHPTLERVIGIAMEPPNQGRGSSEDCIYAGQKAWTEEEVEKSESNCRQLGIMGSLKMTKFSQDEFPFVKPTRRKAPPASSGGPNREERRALASKLRKGKPS